MDRNKLIEIANRVLAEKVGGDDSTSKIMRGFALEILETTLDRVESETTEK